MTITGGTELEVLLDENDEAEPVVRPSAPAEKPVGRLERVAGGVMVTVFVGRVLAVDLGGIVTNDSVSYLVRSEDPFDQGLMVQGYRQIGYPLWVWLADKASILMASDRIFAVAALQRLSLILAVILLWVAMRWWSVPVLVVATSATFVLFADYVLNEGILIPVCLLVAALAAGTIREVPSFSRFPVAVLLITASLSVAMATMKLQYASLLFLAAAIGWHHWRAGRLDRRLPIAVGGVSLALVGLLVLAQAVENQRELGRFEPVSEQIRADWYGAWQAIFVVSPENAEDPALAEYWDSGNLYTFLHGIEADVPDYAERSRLVEERVDAMLDAADTSVRSQQLWALWGALRGGRTDDLMNTTERVLDDRSVEQVSRLSPNFMAREDGIEQLFEVTNEGRRTDVATLEPLLGRLQNFGSNHRGWLNYLGVGAMALSLAGLALPGPHRAYLIASIGMMGGVSVVLASAFIDNARYLAGPLLVSVVGAMLALEAIVGRWRMRSSLQTEAQ
ncbi:MAG: hypothetical protein ACE367_06120 [Acidimicrobiales bacterium]